LITISTAQALSTFVLIGTVLNLSEAIPFFQFVTSLTNLAFSIQILEIAVG
jgi:hypothetical protein